jgi:type II secretory pathway component PulK
MVTATRLDSRATLNVPRGFALMTMLWLIISAGALTAIVTFTGRDAFRAARNRVNGERSLWIAEGCLSLAHGAIDELLLSVASSPALGSRVWRALDTAVAVNPLLRGSDCGVTLQAAGTRVDVNGNEELIRGALSSISGASVVPLLDALLDWRDADSVPRPLGAEAFWYATQSRYHPRNDSVTNVRELTRIRGFEQINDLTNTFGVEPGRVSIANAPSQVLAAVPGFTPETVALILDWRSRGWQVNDLLALQGSLSTASSDSLLARFPEISRLTTLEPDAWILLSIGTAGTPADSSFVELRLVRTQNRAVIVRRRSWS